jgi:hypothetical protein
MTERRDSVQMAAEDVSFTATRPPLCADDDPLFVP